MYVVGPQPGIYHLYSSLLALLPPPALATYMHSPQDEHCVLLTELISSANNIGLDILLIVVLIVSSRRIR